jgi:hypothetical protein
VASPRAQSPRQGSPATDPPIEKKWWIPYPGSKRHRIQTHILNLESLMTNLWAKITTIVSVLAKKKFFTCSKIKLFTIL